MTQARRQLVNPTHAGTFHCINRGVRRSWLCGEDEYTRQSFEHRKPWVEKRILELGDIFACGIYSYAVMSNHLHLVVHMSPQTSNAWTPMKLLRAGSNSIPPIRASYVRKKQPPSSKTKHWSPNIISIQVDQFIVVDEILERADRAASQRRR